VKTVPLLLVDVLTEEGATGRCYLFCYTASGARAVAAHIIEAAELARGREGSPLGIGRMLSRRYALLGVTGTVRMALSAIDVALWDALGVSLGQPLAVLLGSTPRSIPAYDSRGLGLVDAGRLAAETVAVTASGLRALKVRLGHPSLAEDLLAVETVQANSPNGTLLMVDYNQALTRAEAMRRGRSLQEQGLAWIEEPIRHDDYAGNAAIARALDLPLQIGENFSGPEAMAAALAAGACDYVMPDVARIGGVSGWLQAAALAHAHGVEMSSHLMPEISVHLLSATPTAHWLEYVDWADAILAEPLVIRDGHAMTPDRPGLGIMWDEAKLRRLDTV
jgi:mandelate racemase